MKYAIGVDIGGTKVAVALISDSGEIIRKQQTASQTASEQALFQCVVKLINQVLADQQLTIREIVGIGVGLPGKVDVEQGIAIIQNNIPWKNFPLVKKLKEVYGDIIVKIDNDVKVAAYAEYRFLQLQNKELFTYITLSTGIAATTIVHNKTIRGEGFSGEIGFVPVAYFNEQHPLEKVCSGGGIEKKARELYQQSTITTKEVFERWRKGEAIATEIIENTAQAIATVVYVMICLLDPKAFVFGGSIANYNPDFIELIRLKLAGQLHSEQRHILEQFFSSTLKGDNGVIGAGLLVFQN